MIIFETETPKGDHIQIARKDFHYEEYWEYELIVNKTLIVTGTADTIYDLL